MKPRERVEIALNHEKPDRCPVQMGYTPEFYTRLEQDLHRTFDSEYLNDVTQIISGDMQVASVGWSTSYYLDDKPYTDEWGVGWIVHPYETPFGIGNYTEICNFPLSDEAAISGYTPPDPNRVGLYKEAEQLVAEYKEEYWIVGQVHTTVFETAWALRGLEQMLRDMAANPDLANIILEIPYRYHLRAAKRLVEIGVDMIFLGDDVGAQNQMLISPEMWRRFLKPRMANLISELKDNNSEIKVAYHTDGYIEPIILDLIEIGVDVLNPVQPASMDPAKIKKNFGDNLCFWGTIDQQQTLPFGTPQDVVFEVETRLRTVGYDGGLILAPTHAVQLDTPLENFYALIESILNSLY